MEFLRRKKDVAASTDLQSQDIGLTASSLGTLCLSTSSAASGIVAQYRFKTCFRAGLRIGFGRKKSMPDSMHSLTLLSSANAVRATIGAE